jgi:hypothetical protein
MRWRPTADEQWIDGFRPMIVQMIRGMKRAVPLASTTLDYVRTVGKKIRYNVEGHLKIR